MRSNPSIILSGNQGNLLGSIAQGQAMGAEANAIQRQNALATLYRDHGSAIASGDQEAVNLLAGHSPQAALDIQTARLGQDATRQNMTAQAEQLGMERERLNMVREQARQAASAQAASLAADARVSEAERIDRVLSGAVAAQTPEQWNRAIVGGGLDPEEYRFEDRFMIIGGLEGALEGFNLANPAEPEEPASIVALRIRANEAGLQPNTPEYEEFMATGGKNDGMSLTTNPDGSMSFATGSAATAGNGKSLTVDEGKNTGFLIRATDAEAALSKYAGEGTSLGGRLLSAVPMGLGNYGQSEEYQLFDQAKRDFVNAILRRESGAVISEQEFDNADKQYFPQPGDSEAVMAQKAQNRANAIEGLRVGSGDGVNRVEIPEPAPQRAAPVAALPGADLPMATDTPNGVSDLAAMSDADLTKFLEENGGMTNLSDAQLDAIISRGG